MAPLTATSSSAPPSRYSRDRADPGAAGRRRRPGPGRAEDDAGRREPGAPAVIVLTTFDADELILRAMEAGAAGFLLKNTPPADIVAAIESVHAGDGSLSPSIAARLIALVAGDSDAAEHRRQAAGKLASLTAREQQVAAAVSQGQSNAEIARHLHMSLATVKAHVSRLLTKLDADNRVQIALLVQQAATRAGQAR